MEDAVLHSDTSTRAVVAKHHRPIRVAMALYGDLTYDSRVRKEARTLAGQGYEVTVLCLASDAGSSDLPASVQVLVCEGEDQLALPGQANPFRSASTRRFTSWARRGAWLHAYSANLRAWGRSAVAAGGPADIWHAHDLTGLAAVASAIPKDVPIIYDSHELYLETATPSRLPIPVRILLRQYERRLVGRAAAVITVNDEIAAVLRQRYRPRLLEVVHNCPELSVAPSGRPDSLRAAAGIPSRSPVVLYHGALGRGRGIENLIAALRSQGLEEVHLVLMGSGPDHQGYIKAAGDPGVSRVHVLDPVPPSDLLPWVASADVGAIPNPGWTLNDRLSAPNKLFECFAAGIPVVASNLPTMRRIILGNPGGPLGTVFDADRMEDIADALRSVLGLGAVEAESLRQRCLSAARSRWNWQMEAGRLIALYDEVVDRSAARRPQA